MYRGTDAQNTRVAQLVESLRDIGADQVTTIEFYKLKHGKAADVADIVQNLLSNSSGSGNRGSLLGRGLGGGRSNTTRPSSTSGSSSSSTSSGFGSRTSGTSGSAFGSGGGGVNSDSLTSVDGADVFVLADEPNNQLLVKAPAKLQPQFRDLISKIDLRRPQVYIDCKIIVVTSNDSFRLAVEAQQIIGQFAFNTNFGLGSLTFDSCVGQHDDHRHDSKPQGVATGSQRP